MIHRGGHGFSRGGNKQPSVLPSVRLQSLVSLSKAAWGRAGAPPSPVTAALLADGKRDGVPNARAIIFAIACSGYAPSGARFYFITCFDTPLPSQPAHSWLLMSNKKLAMLPAHAYCVPRPPTHPDLPRTGPSCAALLTLAMLSVAGGRGRRKHHRRHERGASLSSQKEDRSQHSNDASTTSPGASLGGAGGSQAASNNGDLSALPAESTRPSEHSQLRQVCRAADAARLRG